MVLINLQGCREVCVPERSEFECTLSCKTDFGKYFCYFKANCFANSLQLQVYLDVNRIPAQARVNQLLPIFANLNTKPYENKFMSVKLPLRYKSC